jgi:hypothetical protein
LHGAELVEHREQSAAVDLECRAAGQSVDDEDAGRHFVGGQQCSAVFAQLVAIGFGAGAQFDCGDGDLTKSLIGYGRNRGVCDRRVSP